MIILYFILFDGRMVALHSSDRRIYPTGVLCQCATNAGYVYSGYSLFPEHFLIMVSRGSPPVTVWHDFKQEAAGGGFVATFAASAPDSDTESDDETRRSKTVLISNFWMPADADLKEHATELIAQNRVCSE